jgi:pimeloyl-ACP methyl ester carboxylesterase
MTLAVLVLLAPFRPGLAADRVVDGVPLPSDATVTDGTTALHRQWSGVWTGSWDGSLKHILVVESIASDGTARVVYAIGGNSFGLRPQWSRHAATMSDKGLSISDGGFSVTYVAKSGESLEATYVRGNALSQATMVRSSFAALTAAGAVIDWTGGRSEFLQTALVEDGKPIRLEAAIFKPSGPGPFPLAVINHGSTGSGRDEGLFKQTWYNEFLASFLNERGWIVAFPQRRGRGKSDGLYDEGFAEDRRQGYACEKERSLAGADRALRDVEAAVASLRRRPDVAGSPILFVGQSRGGALSMAYAGDHPERTLGVINFVGGWMGERCPVAEVVNQTVFKRAARFDRPTLWLYGRNDSFYSIAHSRLNFAAFREAGGKGTFQEFDVGRNGHFVIGSPRLWSVPVSEYLESLRSAPK